MRRVAATLVIGLAVIAGCGGTKWSDRVAAPTTVPAKPTTPASVPRGWVAYRDPSGLTLRHPPKWTTQPSQLGPVYIFIDPAGLGVFRRNINILSEPLPAATSATAYLQLSLSEVAQAGGQVEDSRATLLGGLVGRQLTWHVTKNGTTIRFLSVWTLRNQAAYIVTYTADDAGFDAPIADVRRLIASIRLPT
jgi:hypothetical protein